jgi:hypothetical protein
MKRIFAAGEGSDLIDLAASFGMIIERAGLLENPGIKSFVKSGKPLQLSLPDLRSDSVEILLFEQESRSRGEAAQATLLAAEPLPKKLDPLV